MAVKEKKNSMKKGKAVPEKAEGPTAKPPGKKRKFPIKKIILGFLALLLCAGISFGVVKYLNDENRFPNTKMVHATLPKDILEFTFRHFRTSYFNMVSLDQEIQLIDKEIQRLTGIETEFPDQKKITSSAIKVWSEMKDKLLKGFSNQEKKLEALYVRYRIDVEKGQKIMDAEKPALEKGFKDLLTESKSLTQRILINKNDSSFITKIKNIFFSPKKE